MASTKEKNATTTPKQLAEELGVDAKRIRAYLRSNFARETEMKNTGWQIDAKTADATREYFKSKAKSEDKAKAESK